MVILLARQSGRSLRTLPECSLLVSALPPYKVRKGSLAAVGMTMESLAAWVGAFA